MSATKPEELIARIAEHEGIIANLKRELEAVRKEEAAAAKAHIAELMKAHGFTGHDFLKVGAKPAAPAKPAKYRNPEDGATWSGTGRAPKWIEGKDHAQFLVK